MIIVTAALLAKEDKVDEIKELAEDLILKSREHEGNITYNLYEDILDKSLTFIEKWESKEALENHMKTEEFIEFAGNVKEYLKEELKVDIFHGELIVNNE